MAVAFIAADLSRRLQGHLQKWAVGVEEEAQEVVGGEGDLKMGQGFGKTHPGKPTGTRERR